MAEGDRPFHHYPSHDDIPQGVVLMWRPSRENKHFSCQVPGCGRTYTSLGGAGKHAQKAHHQPVKFHTGLRPLSAQGKEVWARDRRRHYKAEYREKKHHKVRKDYQTDLLSGRKQQQYHYHPLHEKKKWMVIYFTILCFGAEWQNRGAASSSVQDLVHAVAYAPYTLAQVDHMRGRSSVGGTTTTGSGCGWFVRTRIIIDRRRRNEGVIITGLAQETSVASAVRTAINCFRLNAKKICEVLGHPFNDTVQRVVRGDHVH